MGRQLCEEDKDILKVNKDGLTIDQLISFCKDARPLDLLEAELMYGCKFGDFPIKELKNAWVLQDTDDGTVYAIGGIDNHIVWMLCTNAVERNPVTFLRFIRRFYRETIGDYKMLWNYALTDNKLHINWLSWLGATFHDEIELNNKKFIRFIFRRKEDR